MIAIDTNIYQLQNVLHLSNRRMKDYASSTIDEILKAEAAQGNTNALSYARKLYNNTDELVNNITSIYNQNENNLSACSINYPTFSKLLFGLEY